MDHREIRSLFHTINNELHKITVQTGSAARCAKLKDLDTLSDKELKEECRKFLGVLTRIEEVALCSGDEVQKLKDKIYTELKIDASKFK